MVTYTKTGRVRFRHDEAIAVHMGVPVTQVERRRYAPTRTPCPIYFTGTVYVTASRKGGYPRPNPGWNWHRIPSEATRLHGWRIWQHREKAR